ncbi:MAG TPA: ATP-binding protein [Polyangiales bacterium]
MNPSLDSRTALDPRHRAAVGAARSALAHVSGASEVWAEAQEATPAASDAVTDTAQDLDEFHTELRRRCLPIFLWSGCLFNTVYLAWSGFDYLLAPEHFGFFLGLRAIVAVFNTVLVITVCHHRSHRFVWEALLVWMLVKGAFIALMLAVVEANAYMAYLIGFTLVIYGAGMLPYWPPRWALGVVLPLVATPFLRLTVTSSPTLWNREVATALFIVISSAGLSLIIAHFKYSHARRDFLSQRALRDLAQREHDSRMDLDRAGSALRAALVQLKELDRLKSQFFANISHELRTPLTLILTPLETMRRELGLSPHAKNVEVVRRNAARLLRLIDDLLELSRLDAGGLRLHLSDVDLRALTSTVYENALGAANSRQIRFDLSSDTHVQRVAGDAHRLEIVLTNLVSNALKFTPHGGAVAIKVHHLAEGAQIDVSDTGPGISEEDLPHVFERFFQVLRTDRRRLQGGVGIGLALAKELVELHGGKLWVRSSVDQGSVFSVFLPYGREHIRPEVIERRARDRHDTGPTTDLRPSLAGTPSPDAAHGLSVPPPEPKPVLMRGRRRARIVVAEDQDELRGFIAELLSGEYELSLAEDGQRALELIRATRPDLVISDVMMPKLSGAQLCAAIKNDPQLAKTPVILLTARVGAEATLEGYAHGADDFVAKPFHPQVLQARVRAQLMLRKMALDLAEREKLAAVGTLSAGVLHEVRNPVNAILNAARVLAEGPVEADTAQRLLGVVADCAGRIHQLTRALDAHASPADGETGSLADVVEGMEATLALLSHRLRGVELTRRYEKRALVQAPAGPINQIFLNLLDNALIAGAKQLSIEIAPAENGLVRIEISDDGPGVPCELRERIFDAFVSGSVKGSGLGLYLSRCIAEQHGGSLTLSEAPRERGASFVVTLLKGGLT